MSKHINLPKPEVEGDQQPKNSKSESEAAEAKDRAGFTRRSFLAQLSATGMAASAVPLLHSMSAAQVETSPAPAVAPANGSPVEMV